MSSVRAIVRAAVYRPRAGVSDVGHRAPDEDRFTLEATAIERLLGDRAFPPAPWTIRAAGDAPTVAPWGFAAFLGAPVDISWYPGGESGLRAAISAALSGSRPEIVVAADLPGAPGDVERRANEAGGDGAVAFLVDNDPAPTERSTRPSPVERADGEAVPAAAAWFRALPPGARGNWVGDWEVVGGGPNAPPSPPRLDAADRPGGAVSEGAYLPRPRYLEGLPSRWRMVGERCAGCGRTSFPLRGRCRNCGRSDGLVEVPLPRDGGTVTALTWIGAGGQPTEFDDQVEATGGYGVAIVEIAPGTQGTFQLTDTARGELGLGSKVDTRLRRLYFQDGEWRYGRKAVPATVGARRPAADSGEPR